MTTKVRATRRNLENDQAHARRGETVRVHNKEREFLFTAATARKSLLGAARGKITIRGDLNHPTLAADSWQPAL